MDLYKHLSKKDAIDLLELTYKASRCTNSDDLREVVLDLRNFVDFDHGFCAYGNVSVGSDKVIDVLDCSEFFKAFLSEKMYEDDPVALELFNTWQIQYWADIHKKYPVEEIMAFERDVFNTNNGLTYGVSDLNTDYAAVFSFAGKKVKPSPRTEAVIKYSIPHLAEPLIRLSKEKKDGHDGLPKLSKRELEVLKWIKEGKTSFETSVILSISERTVNFHVRNIMKKLDVINRIQAVAKALEIGLIAW